MRAHPGMAVVAAIYLALAVLYSLVTPIFEAPDELWHFLVIRQIVDHRSLPVQVKPPENSLSRQEASQPPLYYMMAAAILAPEAIKGGRAVTGVDDVAHVNPDGRPGDTQATENRNIVFHSPDEGFPYSGTALRIHFLRLLSIAMGLVTIVATYALALDLATGWHQHPRALALGAAALNAAIPQFLFIVSSVNNDNLATMLSSLTLLAMVRFYQSSTISSPSVHRSLTLPLGRTEPSALTGITSGDAPKPPLPEGERAGVRGDAHEKTSQSTSEAHPFSALTRSNPVKPTVFPAKPYIYLGLLMGALALSKLSALTLLPLILVTVLVSIPRRQWASTVKPASWFVVTFALVAGWWYLRNLWLYGDPTGLNAMMEWLGRRIGPYSWSEVFPDLAHLWTSSWALFGWSNVPADDWVYYLFGLLAALSLLGWLVLLARRRSVPRHARFGLAIIVSYLVLLALSLVRYHMMTVAAEGRLLFPAISGTSSLLFFGLAFLTPARYVRHLAAVASALLLAMAAIVPLRSIAPAYAQPIAQSVGWPPAMVREVHVNYGDMVELVAFGTDQAQLQPGKTARFTFQWKPLGKMSRTYRFYVHLEDHNGRSLGQIDVYPGKGVYPIHLWPRGRPFFETYQIPIVGDAPAPGVATLIAGMYDADETRNVPARDPNGAPLGSAPRVGRLKIAAPGPLKPRFDVEVEKTLGGSIVLSGYSLAPDPARPGGAISGSIVWRSLTPVSTDYVVFVQLLGPQGLVAQHDSQPERGNYPTSFWDSGELVADSFNLRLEDSVPEGEYTLIAGMYDPATGRRLSRTDGDYVELKRIRVER